MNPKSPADPNAPKCGPDKDLRQDDEGGRQQGAAESAAFRRQTAPDDPELAVVVEAWDTLPEPIRASILAMVKAANDTARG